MMRLVILAALLATISLASAVDRVVPEPLADSVLLEVGEEEPTEAPSEPPTDEPSKTPTVEPTVTPSHSPTDEPTEAPTGEATEAPSAAPTKEPSTCQDKTLEDGEEWHDSSGNEYDCYWYSNGDNCQVYGDAYATENKDANQVSTSLRPDTLHTLESHIPAAL
jgi:outer membrane biosynthesis protein TonB